MRARDARSVTTAALGALLFGIAMSVFKGNGGGVRNEIGNLSAPWLLLPFIAAARAGAGRLRRGAVVGLLVSVAALGGFYAANSFVLHLGPHPWLDDLRLAFGNGYFFKFALLSGPLFGALGAWWQRSASTAIGVAVAALLVFEPLAWLLYAQRTHTSYTSESAVWVGEILVGVAACLLAATVARRRRGGGGPLPTP